MTPPEPTIPELIADCDEKLAKATPLPWRFIADPFDNSREILAAEVDGEEESVFFGMSLGYETIAANHEYAAAAVNAYPRLKREIERQAAELERLQKGIEAAPCSDECFGMGKHLSGCWKAALAAGGRG